MREHYCVSTLLEILDSKLGPLTPLARSIVSTLLEILAEDITIRSMLGYIEMFQPFLRF